MFETTSSYTIFFTKDGLFEKGIPLPASVEVGDEAFYKPFLNNRRHKAIFNSAWTAPVLSIVATLVLLFSVLLPGQTTVSAYVQIDINPSVELGIDNEGTVYSFKGLNEDGVAIKRDIAFWKGKPLSWVLDQIVDRTETIIKKTDEIEITAIYENDDDHDHDQLERVIIAAVSSSTSEVLSQKQNINISEATVSARDAANKQGISVQEYNTEIEEQQEEKRQKKEKPIPLQQKSEKIKRNPVELPKNDKAKQQTPPTGNSQKDEKPKNKIEIPLKNEVKQQSNQMKNEVKQQSNKKKNEVKQQPNQNQNSHKHKPNQNHENNSGQRNKDEYKAGRDKNNSKENVRDDRNDRDNRDNATDRDDREERNERESDEKDDKKSETKVNTKNEDKHDNNNKHNNKDD
ncbi:anti-sigma-I factor RsgI family protein [Paenisporosarcina sp. NPDC076898]|uniref:anti-sigma-I factor RsgI family protein n=1 Tax=unclassified Paenisporosarcina TaxID=2642018 RepID=UPI003D010CC1